MKQIFLFILLLTVVAYSQPIDTSNTSGTVTTSGKKLYAVVTNGSVTTWSTIGFTTAPTYTVGVNSLAIIDVEGELELEGQILSNNYDYTITSSSTTGITLQWDSFAGLTISVTWTYNFSTSGGSGGLSRAEVESIVGDTSFALRNEFGSLSSIATKAPIASPTFTGTVTIPSPFTLGSTSITTTGTQLNYINSLTSNAQTQLNAKEGTITAGTSSQYFRGDKTWATLNSTAVGLGNVTNESKATMFTAPTFTTSVALPATITIGGTTLLPDITELNRVDGVTSNIQTQLNANSLSSNFFIGTDSIHYGQDSIVVSHGVGSTPRFISIQLMSDSFGFRTWVNVIGATTFSVKRNDPVALDTPTTYIKFKWMAYK